MDRNKSHPTGHFTFWLAHCMSLWCCIWQNILMMLYLSFMKH